MKVLFVSSGNAKDGISPIVRRQGISLEQRGIKIEYFTVSGKGLINYLRSIAKLKQKLSENRFDIIHAHYALCGWIALFSKSKEKLIVSFMGSDILGSHSGLKSRILKILALFNRLLSLYCDCSIVKSLQLKSKILRQNKCLVIPNGVDIEDFKPESKWNARNKLGIDKDCKAIIFVANPNRKVKNVELALGAFEKLKVENSKLFTVYDKTTTELNLYYNAADVLILTSLFEGSPNVIKEAMACNCPIVSTDVGDVKWLLEGIEGCYISSFDTFDFSDKLRMALAFAAVKDRAQGRQRLIDIRLDSESVAKRFFELYNELIG